MLQLRAPMRWRFLEADDVAAYGDRWWTWDEAALLGLKGRELIAIEETLGSILAVLRGLHQDAPSTLATMQAMWVSMTRAGTALAWDDFNPVVFATEWEMVPVPDPLDGGEAPAPASDSSPPPPENAESPAS